MEASHLEFMNSEFRDFRGRWVRDDLQQPEWLEQFLARWNLQVGQAPDAAILAQLTILRGLLVHAVENLAEGQISEPLLAALNGYLRDTSLQRRLIAQGGRYQLVMVVQQRDWNWVQQEIVASFAQALVDHEVRRFKICANAHCRSVFFDESKSCTKRYCTTDKCANLLKVRRFRERHKQDV